MKNTFFVILLLLALVITSNIQAQVGIGIMTADPSAQLDVTSTSKGFLPPRMTTTERDSISTPATGLVIFNTTTNSLEYKSSTGWVDAGQTATISAMQAQIVTMQSQIAALLSQVNGLLSTVTVTIGSQLWTTQNLNVSTYRDGTPIPKVENAAAWASLTTGAYCYYNNDSATYAAVYGKLYNWYAVAGIYDASSLSTSSLRKNLAPAGYKIPTDDDWATLELTLGANAGTQMKSTSGWSNDGNGTNSSGFAGLPGGYSYDGTFYGIGYVGGWWSSTEYGTADAWYRYLSFSFSNVSRASDNKKVGFSVRCLRD